VSQTDIEIAQAATLRPIVDLARERLGIPAEALEPYGRTKAKIDLAWLRGLDTRPNGKLVLVTAITPTPAGEGKTTTVVGLGDAINRLGRRAVIALREPSLGPVFGLKGGAAGGGRAQVVPMEDINLHFTGDFGAVALAHNLLAALIDNHIHHGNALRFDLRRITWKRVVDMNDRALRQIVVGMGGAANGFPREDGFDIVVASEVMAILCLAESLSDLKARLGRIIVGRRRDLTPIRAAELQAHGAMATLLKEAIKPNLVQTLEGNPALVHGGPFANIAHGCNSLIATRAALKLGDYVVTEAGFGADLGAEKFIDIKCRQSGLAPDAAVVVATLRALKHQGGLDGKACAAPDAQALQRGLPNLERHVHIVREVYGLPCVVALNLFPGDGADEIELLRQAMQAHGVSVVPCRHWAEGGAGAEDLAHAVIGLAESGRARMRLVYRDDEPLWDKMRAIAQKVYGAADIAADPAVRARIERLQDEGFGGWPVCVAKTPYSFTGDARHRGAPSGHTVIVRDVRLAAGAEFVVMICGEVMTMPGLPAAPAAMRIDIDDDGRVSGLF
jgi:formate--tetrahydrofolate ligase